MNSLFCFFFSLNRPDARHSGLESSGNSTGCLKVSTHIQRERQTDRQYSTNKPSFQSVDQFDFGDLVQRQMKLFRCTIGQSDESGES